MIRFAFWLAALLAVSACTSSREMQKDDTREASSVLDTHTVVDRAPERITTTTEEYAEPEPGRAPEPTDWGMPAAMSGADQPSSGVSKTLPARGSTEAPCHLVKRTVVVEERGAVRTDTAAEGHAEAHGEAKSDDKKSSKPSGIVFGGVIMWALVALAVVILAFTLARKARLL